MGSRGFKVFPVHSIGDDGGCTCKEPGGPTCTPGKHPRTRQGFEDATSDSDQIEKWWTRWPDANVAVIPGSNGCVVVDVDPRDGGDEHLDRRCNGSGPLPATLTIATGEHNGKRGRHFWFRAEEARLSSGKNLKDGIQLKASGGYVLVPPSRHASGVEYEVVST